MSSEVPPPPLPPELLLSLVITSLGTEGSSGKLSGGVSLALGSGFGV